MPESNRATIMLLHIIKTDWFRLRWLIMGYWLLVIITAWPALTFSPAHFDNPPPAAFGNNRQMLSILAAQGEASPVKDWLFQSAEGLLTLVGLIFAGALGFQSLRWTEARPLGKGTVIAAKLLELLFFLAVPQLLIAPVTSLAQGFGMEEALFSLSVSATTLVPRLVAVCIFGALCGGWLRWIGGMFIFLVMSQFVPLITLGTMNANWRFVPRSISTLPGFITLPHACIVIAILCVILVYTSRHTHPWRRMSLSILAALAVPVPLSKNFFSPVNPPEKLPDWSASVRPSLTNLELGGKITTDPVFPSFGPSSMSHQEKLEVLFKWETDGLPAGSFAMWAPGKNGNLTSGAKIISSRMSGYTPIMYSNGAGTAGFDQKALTAAIAPPGTPVKWKAFHGELTETPGYTDVFETVPSSAFKTASLDTDLKGFAYRIVKLADVPFGRAAETTLDGIRLHIRKLDIVGRWPVVDIVFLAPLSSAKETYFFDTSWIPVLHFPKTGEYHLLDNAYDNRSRLASGHEAVRRMYWACERISGHKTTQDFESARFLLLRREYLATLDKHFVSKPLPLVVAGERDAPDARGYSEPPPFDLRPDPATTSDQEFTRWMTRSYEVFDQQGWVSRNIADYIPRHLETIIQRNTGISPPSSAEGRAIALSCPEDRKEEVISALPRKNTYPDSNWISEVILRRGWIREAAPHIREMAAKGAIDNNPYSQIMVMNLEEPATYPAILDRRMWFELYEQARRLPEVEPILTESVARNYRENSADDRLRSHLRSPMQYCLIPSAHGLPEAFSELLTRWQDASDGERSSVLGEFKKIVLLPGATNDDAFQSALSGKSVDDFHYDTLARRWVPVSSTSH